MDKHCLLDTQSNSVSVCVCVHNIVVYASRWKWSHCYSFFAGFMIPGAM